jgi:isoleucyl-tRNA synthetase
VVVVDTEVPAELRDEGLAREIVHRVQNLRRDAGFDISDRITTYWQGDPDIGRVLSAYGDYVRAETLSVDVIESEPPEDAHQEEQAVDGHQIIIGVRRV